MDFRLAIAICFGATVLMAGETAAAPQQYCVTCEDPDQTYVCSIETTLANPNSKGMQLYCIIRTSKDGGHKSCAISNIDIAQCAGPVRTYSFQAPAIPPNIRDAAQRLRDARDARNAGKPNEEGPQQKGGEPETLIDATGRAIDASRRGIKNTGNAISGVAGSTTGKVGKAARGAGKGVKKAAGKVGSATKKTGIAVGSTAKNAIDCIWSWFKNCGGSE